MKIYNVFTISELNQELLFDTFSTYEDAENFVNDNTDSNIKLVGEGAKLYEKFGCKYDNLTNWKPELVNQLFPFNSVMYGTTVRETVQFGSHTGEFNYIYRFIIETTVK